MKGEAEPAKDSGQPVVWAEIDLGALRWNFDVARHRAGGRRLMPVVKADGYGHGAARVAGTLARAGADALCVAILDEAIDLDGRHFQMDVLRFDFGERPQLVASFERASRQPMSRASSVPVSAWNAASFAASRAARCIAGRARPCA